MTQRASSPTRFKPAPRRNCWTSSGSREYREAVQRQVEKLLRSTPYHSLQLPDGTIIPGLIGIEALEQRVASFPIPTSLRGCRVLDVGAASGWNAFAMAARGALCANITETSCVTAISEQGGKENQHGNDERFCPPAADVTGVFDSGIDDVEGGRAAPRPNPEVLARAKRRTYTGEYKQKVLAEADAARGSGEIGAVLRQHGLYSSHLTKWRQERKSGILEGLAPQKRGPKSKVNPLTAENQKLKRDNDRLTDRLRKAEIVIDVQKKVAMLLGIPIAETEVS